MSAKRSRQSLGSSSLPNPSELGPPPSGLGSLGVEKGVIEMQLELWKN